MPSKRLSKKEKCNDIAATSVEQIVDAAGIGKGTVYEYFHSKEEIFVHAVNNWIMDLIHQLVDKTRNIENPVRRLEIFISNIKDVLKLQQPDPKRLFADIDQQTFMEGGAFYKQRHIIKDMRAAFCNLVADILLDGVSKKVFKPEIARDVSKIAVNLLAYVDGIGMHYLIMEEYQEFEEQVDFYIKWFVDAILM